MRIGAYCLGAFQLFLTLVAFLVKKARKDEKQKEIVHLPFPLAVVGMVCSFLLSGAAVATAITGSHLFYFFLAVVLGCNTMILAYINCVVRYDDTGFCTRNFLGVSRSCTYGEVEGVRSGGDHHIYFQGHRIMIDEISCGGDQFLLALKRGYRKATGQPLPMSTSFKRKWDPMNGHLDYPWFYFILWVVSGLFCLAFPVLFLLSMTAETDVSKIVTREVSFQSYEIRNDTLCLYVEGKDEPYEIDYFRSYGDALPAPEVLCSGELYTVGAVEDRRFVDSLTGPEGTEHITPETERQVYRKHQKIPGLLLCLFSLAGIFFCYRGIAIGRHPERYSPKVRRRYYQDGYLH